MQRKTLLVHLHLYYHKQLDYFIKKLKNITNCEWDLFVTVVDEDPITIKKILKFKPNAKIIKVNNVGYDVYPFIKVLQTADLSKYDFVLKLHTKRILKRNCEFKDKNKSIYIGWRNTLVDSLLGSKEIFNQNIKTLSNETSGMIFNRKYLFELANHYYIGDIENFKKLKEKLNLHSNYQYFAAGTMFMIKSSVLSPIINADFSEKDFMCNENQSYNSGTLAHAFERVFTLLTDEAGLKICTVDVTSKEKSKYYMKYKFMQNLKNIFEIKNEDTHKIVTLCGVKFKFKSKKLIARYNMNKHTNDVVNIADILKIKYSENFDSNWFANYNKNEIRTESLEEFFLESKYRGYVNPSPYFYSNEYLLMYPDVAKHNMNPLIHYEDWGWKEKRFISLADRKKVVFPEGTISIKKELKHRDEFTKKKVAVLASYSGNGRLPETLIYLVKGLKKICDYIIFVSDNPIYEEETEKLKAYCNYCIFERHEEYDFGSYKRGYQFLTGNNILNEDDDLIFVNDSCYGPVYPFSEVIDDYNKKECDFYGLSMGLYPQEYLQSFFYIFKSNVYSSGEFKNFIYSVKKLLSSGHVVYKYEMQFTKILANEGFRYSSYISPQAFKLDVNKHSEIHTKWTLSLLQKYRYPFVKVKVLQGSSVESPQKILEYVKQENNELYNLIKPDIDKKIASIHKKEIKKVSKYTLFKEYDNKLSELRTKISNGKKIKIVFLVNMLSMFAADTLMQKMLKDDCFDIELYVIPDIRFGTEDMIKTLRESYRVLKEKYDFVKMAVDINDNDEITEYNDVIKNADIVCYPSPYDVSYSLYNPFYAFQNNILSIHINYGFFRSKYDRFIYQLDNYNNFWKVFLETDMNFEEYKKYGQCKGTNAVVTGYAKMDNMVHLFENKKTNKRKKIIIAPHHSVDGGCNDVLALSNFEKLSDFFLTLPEKYPQIDFIFRPHPVLFKIMGQNRHWGEEKVQEYLNKLLSHKNVSYSTVGNYLELFANSDGIIQDCGSFLVEYFYTKKPQCYILKNESDIENKFSELGKKCLEHCYISYTENDILNYLDKVILQGEDTKKLKREEFAQNVIMKNYPNVSQNIVDEIKKELVG